ncbi:MAG TPA: SPFH domain-containing protein [Methylovirgula sp.]|jgi:regulator of protease activity HflC (stomatin/prohibitin superfamily)|nr:SPFH domain-containing protein [Methylovirgula sp.]
MGFEGIFTTILFGLLCLIGLRVIFSCYLRTPQYKSKVVAGFGGQFKRATQAGGSWKLPVPFEKVAYTADLTLQITDFQVNVKTKDDNFIDLPIEIHYEITDPIKAARLPDVDRRKQVMQNLAQNVIRSHYADGDIQAVYTSRNRMAEEVRNELQKNMEDYGLTIRDVLVENPILPPDLQRALQSVVIADRNLEASRKTAEAEKVKLVAKAEGEQALLTAQANGERARLLAQAEGEGAIAVAKAKAEKEARTLLGEGVANEQRAVAQGFHDSVEKMTSAGITADQATAFINLTNNRQLERQVAEAYAKAYGAMRNAVLFADIPNHATNGNGELLGQSAGGVKDVAKLVFALQPLLQQINGGSSDKA